MGFLKKYFPEEAGDPSPLKVTTERRVRFEEVDSLSMVWHGRYPSYFEDGRVAFGDRYGMSYQSFKENGTIAPVVQMHIDFRQPLRFDEIFIIETRLHWSESARLNFSYRLLNKLGDITASGYTVQLLTDIRGEIQLISPEWMLEFCRKWKGGSFST